jgi:ligand-binding sensor domain-containing protein
MRKTCLLIAASGLLVMLLAAQALAGISDAAVLFLRIAPGARSAGMGEAFVAIADDASATHWNPAGLGVYPLADTWYEFKLSDDTHLKNLARKALDENLPADYDESFLSWQIRGNTISRRVDDEWRVAEKISIDPSQTFVTNLSRLARTDDKDLFKEATRTICEHHTGISFETINDLRLRLLDQVSGDAALADRVNTMMEEVLVYWQDLRLDTGAFEAFRNQTELLIEQEGGIPEARLADLEVMAESCELESRPAEVEVPYTVLLSSWRSWEVPWEESIEKIVVLENSVPNDNYTSYDIWAITNFGLKRYDGVAWRDGMSSNDDLVVNKGDAITDVLARVLGTTDEEIIGSRLEIVARANNSMSRDEVASLVASVSQAVPSDFSAREELISNLNGYDDAWVNCLIDNDRLEELSNSFRRAYSDSTIDQSEADRLLFASGKVVTDQLPKVVTVPFNVILRGELHDLAVDRKMLLVATSEGLYQFNGRSWQLMSTGSAESAPVYCVESVRRGRFWIGVDQGVMYYEQGQWTTYGPMQGISTGPIRHLHVVNERQVWAAAGKELYRFDGTSWSNKYRYETSVTDSARSVLKKFYGDIDEFRLEFLEAQIYFANQDFVDNPQAGVEIELPYSEVFNGDITSLAVDKNNDLWVGTEMGIKRFDGSRWRGYGYKPVKVQESMSVEEFAADYLGTSDSAKIAGFVKIIRARNTVQKGELDEGRIIYVYDNPAGSPIDAIYNQGGRVFFASLYGTFSYNDGRWERYYHEGLHRTATKDIVGEAGELWFATADRVVVFAHAKREFSFTHSKWLPELAEDLYYEFFTYVQPVGGLGTVGANITFLSFGEIARTSENNPEILETFSSFDGALSLSYGIRASDNIAIGLSARVIYSKLADQGAGAEIGRGSGTSFAVDGGIIYHFNRKLQLGAALTNLGPDMSYIDAAQSDPLPRNLAVGLSYKLIDSPYNRLTIVGELNKLLATVSDDFSTEMKEIIQSVGVEYWYGSLLALRAGYYVDTEGDSQYLTLGVGLQLKGKYRIDFAYIPTSEQHVMGNTLRTSLTMRI